MPRGFGVLVAGLALGGTPSPPFEVGGPRFGSGPRLGRGPVVGTRIDCEDDVLGRGRRLEAATCGGGIRDAVGLGGGAMRVGLLGGGMADWTGACEALCAELMAGNDGGGRLTCSSSSSESSCSLSVKDGTGGAVSSDLGTALGVESGDGLLTVALTVSSFNGDSRWWHSLSAEGSSFWLSCDCSGIVRAPGIWRRVMNASHIGGGRW